MSTTCTDHAYAKCFSSIDVGVESDCDVEVTPNGVGNYVDGMWTGGTAPYTKKQTCPFPGDSALTASSTSSNTLVATLQSILASAIWDVPLTSEPTVTVASDHSYVTITDGSCTLKYRPTDHTDSGFAQVTAVSCTTGPDCATAVSGCSTAGTYAVPIVPATGYVCSVCQAGKLCAVSILCLTYRFYCFLA